MTRFQTLLLLILVVLASLTVGRAVWEIAGLPLAAVIGAVPTLVRALPDWVGWVAFSAIWWLPCALRARGCRTSACSSRLADS